jgi:pimeloyl-ACP methyl ester carboxylesterase
MAQPLENLTRRTNHDAFQAYLDGRKLYAFPEGTAHVLDASPQQALGTVLFIGGFGHTADILRAPLAETVAAGYRLVYADVSLAGEVNPRKTEAQLEAELLHGVLATKAIAEPRIIAHSHGAKVAVRLAQRSRIPELHLINPAGFSDERDIPTFLRQWTHSAVDTTAQKVTTIFDASLRRPSVPHLRSTITKIKEAPDRTIKKVREIAEADLLDEAEQLLAEQTRIVLYLAERDRMFPSYQSAANARKHGILEVYEGLPGGHANIVEYPEEVMKRVLTTFATKG